MAQNDIGIDLGTTSIIVALEGKGAGHGGAHPQLYRGC